MGIDEELERARLLVERAEEALAVRDAELARLRDLTERLLEHCPVAAVIDEQHRIRGWSSRAEQVWAVTSERAVGRPARAVLEGMDPRWLHVPQRVEAPSGAVEVVVEPLGDGPDGHLLVRFP
jgi:PAS domain-containing protein